MNKEILGKWEKNVAKGLSTRYYRAWASLIWKPKILSAPKLKLFEVLIQCSHVGNSKPGNCFMHKSKTLLKLPSGYICKVYMKHKWIVLRLVCHPQDISLCTCKYSKIWKKKKHKKYFWWQTFWIRDTRSV